MNESMLPETPEAEARRLRAQLEAEIRSNSNARQQLGEARAEVQAAYEERRLAWDCQAHDFEAAPCGQCAACHKRSAQEATAARERAEKDARRLKHIIQCLDLGASNRNAYVEHAMLCDAARGIGACECGYAEVAAVMDECSACPSPAVEDGLCDSCHAIRPAAALGAGERT